MSGDSGGGRRSATALQHLRTWVTSLGRLAAGPGPWPTWSARATLTGARKPMALHGAHQGTRLPAWSTRRTRIRFDTSSPARLGECPHRDLGYIPRRWRGASRDRRRPSGRPLTVAVPTTKPFSGFRPAGYCPVRHSFRSPSWVFPRQPPPDGARRHSAAYADVPRRAPDAGALRWWRCRRARRFP